MNKLIMFDFNFFPCSLCDMCFSLRLCGIAYPRYSPAISTAQWKTGWQLLSWIGRAVVNFHNNLMDPSSSSDKQVCAYFSVDLPINSLVIGSSLEVSVFYTNCKQNLSSHSIQSMESTVVPFSQPLGKCRGSLDAVNAPMLWWTKKIN